MSLFSLGSWIAEERKRARKEFYGHADGKNYDNAHEHYMGKLLILRRLSARLRRGR